ncbi:MAG TPA: ABC transporter substrate-binding protein [Mycobacteriales bacterium]|nr:ABC transporter substrate-binding protein [Mycobacteriales bacterium]
MPSESSNLSRRHFLYGSALTAGAVVLAACSSNDSGGSGGGTAGGSPAGGPTANPTGPHVGSEVKALPNPASFTEAPALKGKGLPAVADRLPASPLVTPHRWIERGTYGGSLNMTVFGSTGMANASSCREFFYGISPTRWINDGLDISPGTADRWSSNADSTEWTIHFREGLKWSDGHPFTVDDIIFWYEDIATPGNDAQTVPPDCVSAKGTPCTMTKVDESTLKITYDAPQPLVPDYLAEFAKGNIGQNGPIWVMPSHYLKQFHPKYNKSVPKSWDTTGGLWEQKADWLRNPDCPTLTGFRCKSFDNAKGVVLERNPYYYVVTKDGDQLPYLDTINITIYQNAQSIKLAVQQGKVDYCHGPYNQIDLADVSTLSRTKDSGNYKILMWNSGSGTAEIFFLNYDYVAIDEKYGKLFRDKRFRQAISYAYDRKAVQKAQYFQTGELTTGTEGVTIAEFHAKPDGPEVYKQWRDAFKDHDPEKAKSLLADIGLKDTNNDGYLEFPDGSKLTIDVPYSADISDTNGAIDDRLVADAKAVGIRMVRRPIPPLSYGDEWNAGKFMARTNWEISNDGSVLVYPQWTVPLEATRWAPLEGSWNLLAGSPTQKQEAHLPPAKRHPPRMPPEKGSPVDRLTKLYNQTKLETDAMKRNQLVWKMFQIHITEGPFFIGSVANYPQVITHHVDLQNVPGRDNLALGGLTNPWGFPTPAAYETEAYFWKNPDQHA